MILGCILAGSIFASNASAQQYPSAGMSSMPSQPTPVSGAYANADYGVQITLPDGWSGMEMKLPNTGTMVTVAPGGFGNSQGGSMPAMMMIMMAPKDPSHPPQTTPQNMPQNEKCNNDSSTTKTVNGVSLTETVVDCTGDQSIKAKYDIAQTDKYYVTIGYVATPSSNYDPQIATYDNAVGTFQLANAVAAPAASTTTVAPTTTSAAPTTPAVPEFPVPIVGLIVALMVGAVVILGRTNLIPNRI